MGSRRRRYQLLWLLVCSLTLNRVMSQQGDFSIKKYQVRDGLPAPYIFTIFQDSRGFLWLGTSNGISRFDGRNFVNYNLSDGLPSLSASILFEDSAHRLWTSTRRGIAALINDQFHTYPLSDSALLDYVSDITYIQNTGLIAATSFGTYRFEADHWQKIVFYPGFENHPCHQVVKTKDGIYFNYGDHLVLQKGNSYELIGKKEGQVGPYFTGVHTFSDTTYLATVEGLFEIRGHQRIPIFERILKNKYVGAVFKDKRGRFWVCTDEDGLMISKPYDTKEFTWYIPVTQNLVSGFHEDRSGNLWVACVDGLGLINEKNISHFTRNLAEVNTIFEMPDRKRILVHCRANGFLEFNGSDFKPADIPFPVIPGYHRNADLIDHYSVDDRQRLWFSTRLQKILCLEEGVIKNYSSLAGHTLNIYCVDYSSPRKRLSIAADTLKVGNDLSQQNFISANTHQVVQHPRMIHSFANGSQLVSTRFDGAFLIDNRDNITPINKQLRIPRTVYEFQLLEEPGGRFWVYNNGTGLSRYHWSKDNLPVEEIDLTTSNGLPNNIVNSMCIDKYHRVWAVTPSGLVLITPDSTGDSRHSIYNIGRSLGIEPEDLEHSKLLSTSDGSIWLSKPSDIFRFDPDLVLPAFSVPSISIAGVLVFSSSGKLLEKYQSLQHVWVQPPKVTFLHNENSLLINFNGISFENYEGLQYSFRLQGFDSSWSPPTKNPSVNFVNLPPGDYQFYVRAKNTANQWSAAVSFAFRIETPFWESWWFRLCAVLVATALIVFIFRYRLQQLKSKTLMQNQLLELEMKALKLQMNPHFIHNALNSIQSLVVNNKNEQASRYINKFAKLLRQILENSEKNLIPLESELSSLQLYVDLEKLRMGMEVDYLVDMDPAIMPSQLRIPPLILQPFVENALWHGLSMKAGPKRIILNIRGDADWLVCRVTDNGVGRKAASELYQTFPEGHLSKAVHIIRQRLTDYNHSPGIEPVSFIDHDENGQASGTSVIVRIRIQ